MSYSKWLLRFISLQIYSSYIMFWHLNSLAWLRPALYEASGILLRLNTAAETADFARSIQWWCDISELNYTLVFSLRQVYPFHQSKLSFGSLCNKTNTKYACKSSKFLNINFRAEIITDTSVTAIRSKAFLRTMRKGSAIVSNVRLQTLASCMIPSKTFDLSQQHLFLCE